MWDSPDSSLEDEDDEPPWLPLDMTRHKSLRQLLLDARLSHRLSWRSRTHKINRFQQILREAGGQRVLDVGCGAEWSGAQNTLHQSYTSGKLNIGHLVAIGLVDLTRLQIKYPRISFAYGNGLALPFADKSFALAYSNAVIEHILPLAARRQLVEEMLRVARGVFLTTPNKWFPIEVHSRLPIVHWMPANIHNYVLKRLGMASFSRGIFFDPMSAADLRSCFPKTAQPEIELGLLGMTLIAYYLENADHDVGSKARSFDGSGQASGRQDRARGRALEPHI